MQRHDGTHDAVVGLGLVGFGLGLVLGLVKY